MGAEMRRETSLRIGVHHAIAVVWGPVCRTHLGSRKKSPEACSAAMMESSPWSCPGASRSQYVDGARSKRGGSVDARSDAHDGGDADADADVDAAREKTERRRR